MMMIIIMMMVDANEISESYVQNQIENLTQVKYLVLIEEYKEGRGNLPFSHLNVHGFFAIFWNCLLPGIFLLQCATFWLTFKV